YLGQRTSPASVLSRNARVRTFLSAARTIGRRGRVDRMTTLPESPFQSLTEQTDETLINDIRTAMYLPGAQLREQEIAQSMGVSRAPLREAFRVLERSGLIEIKPWKGASVAEPKREEIEELFDARAEMFSVCARYLAERGSNETIVAVRGEIDRLIASTDE